MPKAATPTPTKSKRGHKPKTTDKAQSERFIEAARELGVEETGEKFDRAVQTVPKTKTAASGNV